MEHSEHEHNHSGMPPMDAPMDDMHGASFQGLFACDGTPFGGPGQAGRSSSWANQFWPGLIILFWALHWNVAVFRNYLTSSKNSPYTASTTYRIPGLIANWPVEGLLKVVIPFVGILVQLWLGHGHWSSNVCEAGSVREGHYSVSHMHSWQNSWNLFVLMVAGMVDVAGHYMELPPNTQHFLTATAFALQGFSLSQGQYQDMLDEMCYYLLYLATVGTTAAMLVEVAVPESFWAGCARVYCMWLQAVWYFACARFLYEGRPAWDSVNPLPDMGPAMYVPVVFVMWMNIVSIGMLLVYLGMRWWYAAHLNEHLRAQSTVERTLLEETPTKGGYTGLKHHGHATNHELMPLVGKHVA